jgi:transcriptional regulator with XRE-family HTH domain
MYAYTMNIVLELRRRAGLTQDLLAKLSGVSSSSISRYESGERSPTLAVLDRLASAAEFDAVVSFVPVSGDGAGRAFARRIDDETKHSDVVPGFGGSRM